MIKLTDLLNEQESFTATSKKSGETVVFKTKDARDAAVKAGTHSKIKDKKDGDSKKDTPKVNIFKKDKSEPAKDDEILVIYKNKRGINKTKSFTDKKSAQKFADANDGELGKIVNGRLKSFPKTSVISKGEEPNDYSYHDEPKKDKKSEPKSEPSKFDIDDVQDFTDVDDLIDKNKSKLSKQQIDKLTQLSADWEDAEGDMQAGGSDDDYQEKVGDIRADVEDILSSKEDEPKRDDNTDAQIDDVQNNIGDLDGDEIRDYAESDIFPYLKGRDLEYAKMFVDDIEDSGSDFVRSADLRNDLKNLFHKKMTLDAPSDSPKDESSTSLRDLLPESIINEGTRSQVGVIGRNGKIVSAYVHYDGYPSNMKPGLKHHMKSDKDVLKLIKMGGARGIFDDKEIEYYKSGKPMKGDSKDVESYIKNADRNEGAEFVYLYNMKDKKWYYADTYKDTKLKKLF